ncbi:MAG: hypothetical protein M3384_15080 [Acidobacteriota bacterium]|nr:hypothetical protein [Acidobacteriota bacterium]
MATNVDIIIKGVAICYMKEGDWHILFPIDEKRCHSIKFTYKEGDNKESEPQSLADSLETIRITTTSASATTGETRNFSRYVFNLTSQRTHPRIRRKGDLRGKAVLMVISKAHFSINRYLQDFPFTIPDLEEIVGDTSTKTQIRDTPIAHSAKARITLNTGENLTVQSDMLAEPHVIDDNNSSYTLIFDNDCEDVIPDRNDMDMFYEVIEEDPGATGSKPGRHFRIGGYGINLEQIFSLQQLVGKVKQSGFGEADIEQLRQSGFSEADIEQLRRILSEPPNFVMGKPCLIVKVTDEESIKTLP